MKSTLTACFCLLVLASCALDIASPPPASPSGKPDYDKVSDGGRLVHHFDGNDVLVWIERHELFPGTDPADPRLKTYHSDAADVLQWYEYRRWEQVAGAWVKTREQRFSAAGNAQKDQGVLVSGKAWSYAAAGLPVLTAYYKPDVLQASNSVWAEAGAGNRILQDTSLDAAGTPLGYDRTWFEPGLTGKKTAHALFDGKLQVTSAQTFTYEGDNRTELVEYKASSQTAGLWNREITAYLSGAATPYRTVWYQSTGAAPAAAGFLSAAESPAAAPALASTDFAGPLDPAVLPTPAVSLLALPVWNAPAQWPLDTLQGFEYVLPGANGSTKIRFDKNQLPTSLVRAAQGTLGAMEIDFIWDAEKRLTQRVVKYAGNPVLTVDFHRDSAGRLDRVATAGSLLKPALTYTLTYDGTASRPDTLVISTGAQALLTFGFTYDDKTAVPSPGGAGLDALNFDGHLRTLSVALDGGTVALPVLALEFPATAANPAAIAVYDILEKTADTRKLIGTLTWSYTPTLHQTGLVWKLAANATATPDWAYTAGWGTWADLAAGMTASTAETGASLASDASRALALADSYDVDKVLQLINAVRIQPNQAQYQRMAASLFDQVKAYSGN